MTSPPVKTNVNEWLLQMDIFMRGHLPIHYPFPTHLFFGKNFQSSLPGFAHLYFPSPWHSSRSLSLSTCLQVPSQLFLYRLFCPFFLIIKCNRAGTIVSFLFYCKMQSQSQVYLGSGLGGGARGQRIHSAKSVSSFLNY